MEAKEIERICNDFYYIEEIAINIAKQKISDKSCMWDSTTISKNHIQIILRNFQDCLFFVEIKYEQIAAVINHKNNSK